MGPVIVKRIFTFLVLPVAIAALVYLNWESIAEPVRYEDVKKTRETVAIQRLKDIRTLQEAHNNVKGYYAATMDSLQIFYREGQMKDVLQIGSPDDSVAVANTAVLEKKLKSRGVKAKDMQQKLYEEYQKAVEKGEVLKIVCAVEHPRDVKDVLFQNRPDFSIDSLAFIPYSYGDSIQMKAEVREVSGVRVPLFEAKAPYKSLLKGLDNQLVVNTICEKQDLGLYPGLKVGDLEKPNNNAGNWE